MDRKDNRHIANPQVRAARSRAWRIARPAVSTERLTITAKGNVRYTLKTPYRDGTTHIVLEPLGFIARLAALVPQRRVNLTRYHGVFAPNSRLRPRVTPARRNPRDNDQTDTPRHAAMTWAQRLKRVFKIDIETCYQCGSAVYRFQESGPSKHKFFHVSKVGIWPKAGDRMPVERNPSSGDLCDCFPHLCRPICPNPRSAGQAGGLNE